MSSVDCTGDMSIAHGHSLLPIPGSPSTHGIQLRGLGGGLSGAPRPPGLLWGSTPDAGADHSVRGDACGVDTLLTSSDQLTPLDHSVQ